MLNYMPRYVDPEGKPIRSERSLWESVFGYKPKYQTVPPKGDDPSTRATAESKPAEGKPDADR
jgi:hypothetical protein